MQTIKQLESDDSTEAIPRTILAWRRTALALAVIALLALKFSIFQNVYLSVVAAIIAFIGASIVFVIGKRPTLAEDSPFWGLRISATVIVLLSVITLLQIF